MEFFIYSLTVMTNFSLNMLFHQLLLIWAVAKMMCKFGNFNAMVLNWFLYDSSLDV